MSEKRNYPAGPAGRTGNRTEGRARRRLFRALGGGGLALGAVVAAGWQRPVVRSVVLPAHAQISPGTGEDGPVGCAIAASVDAVPASAGDFTVAVRVFDTDGEIGTLASMTGNSASTSASGSSTVDIGAYTFRGDVSVAAGEVSISSNFSCCDDTRELSLSVDTDGSSIFFGFDVTDDGECDLLL